MGNTLSYKRSPAEVVPKEPPKGDIDCTGINRSSLTTSKWSKFASLSRYPPQPETTKTISSNYIPTPSCTTYAIWETCYQRHILDKSKHDALKSRISDQASDLIKELEEKRLRIQREREKAESRLFSERESYVPKLTLSSSIDLTSRYRSFRPIDDKYFPPRLERPELTNEMLMIIERASKEYPPDETLTTIDGVEIHRRDITTLTKLNWLNDEIINAYMFLLVQRSKRPNYPKVYAFNTFFYPKVRESGYNSVRRWTRKVDIFSYDYLLVPVHLGNHWCLAFIDLPGKKISYFDSMGGSPHGCCDTLLDYLRYELKDKKKQELDDENWRHIDKYHEEGIPIQQNCSDCGVFACTYAEHLTRNAKLKFEQKDMPYYRRKMIYELLNNNILE